MVGGQLDASKSTCVLEAFCRYSLLGTREGRTQEHVRMPPNHVYVSKQPVPRDPEMVYPRISGDKVIPRLSGVLKILKVMDHAYGAYVLQSEV